MTITTAILGFVGVFGFASIKTNMQAKKNTRFKKKLFLRYGSPCWDGLAGASG